jgi:hypothetical protein
LERQLAEQRRRLAHALDAVTWAEDCLGELFPGGLALDDWQREVIDAITDARPGAPDLAIEVSRQGGKSTAVAIAAAWIASFRPATALVLAPGLRQSTLLARKIIRAAKLTLPPGGVPLDEDTRTALELPHGGRVEALPATPDKIRGHTVGVGGALVLDEAQAVPDELFAAAQPIAATGGKTVLIGTPGERPAGFFFEAVRGTDPRWRRISVDATRIGRLSPDVLAKFRRTLGERRFAREFLLDWSDPGQAAFSFDAIVGMFGGTSLETLDELPAPRREAGMGAWARARL